MSKLTELQLHGFLTQAASKFVFVAPQQSMKSCDIAHDKLWTCRCPFWKLEEGSKKNPDKPVAVS